MNEWSNVKMAGWIQRDRSGRCKWAFALVCAARYARQEWAKGNGEARAVECVVGGRSGATVPCVRVFTVCVVRGGVSGVCAVCRVPTAVECEGDHKEDWGQGGWWKDKRREATTFRLEVE